MASQEQTPAVDHPLTAEEIIQWLDGYRQLMFEIWQNHPELYQKWKNINS